MKFPSQIFEIRSKSTRFSSKTNMSMFITLSKTLVWDSNFNVYYCYFWGTCTLFGPISEDIIKTFASSEPKGTTLNLVSESQHASGHMTRWQAAQRYSTRAGAAISRSRVQRSPRITAATRAPPVFTPLDSSVTRSGELSDMRWLPLFVMFFAPAHHHTICRQPVTCNRRGVVRRTDALATVQVLASKWYMYRSHHIISRCA